MFAIKKMRERAGLKQQEAAEKLGITTKRYGNWEREDREINLRDAIRIADLFGCTLDELAGRDFPAATSPPLSGDERDLLEAYRAVEAPARRRIARAVEGELDDMEDEAKKEARRA